jgi:hypothetical protein
MLHDLAAQDSSKQLAWNQVFPNAACVVPFLPALRRAARSCASLQR